MPDTKWQKKVATAASRRAAAQEKAEAAYDDFYETLLDAFEAGASYRTLAEWSGLSRIRVGQALRIARGRRDEHQLAAVG
jgi:hypothetical protein